MTDEERDIAACLLIEKAERNFEQAQKNADMGSCGESVILFSISRGKCFDAYGWNTYRYA